MVSAEKMCLSAFPISFIAENRLVSVGAVSFAAETMPHKLAHYNFQLMQCTISWQVTHKALPPGIKTMQQ
jgi:hypothetical protein